MTTPDVSLSLRQRMLEPIVRDDPEALRLLAEWLNTPSPTGSAEWERARLAYVARVAELRAAQ